MVVVVVMVVVVHPSSLSLSPVHHTWGEKHLGGETREREKSGEEGGGGGGKKEVYRG